MKLVRESIIEGVGDKYAERRWGIPDEEKTAEREYLSGAPKEGEHVVAMAPSRRGDGTHKVKIVMNPPNFAGIEPRVRGLIDKDGNYYTETVRGLLVHNDIILSLLNVRALPLPVTGHDSKGQPSYSTQKSIVYNEWHKTDPMILGFITVQRYNDTKQVWIGESNLLIQPPESFWYMSHISDHRRWSPVFQSFMDSAQKKNPGIEFVSKLVEED